jgi:hypothetical protein
VIGAPEQRYRLFHKKMSGKRGRPRIRKNRNTRYDMVFGGCVEHKSWNKRRTNALSPVKMAESASNQPMIDAEHEDIAVNLYEEEIFESGLFSNAENPFKNHLDQEKASAQNWASVIGKVKNEFYKSSFSFPYGCADNSSELFCITCQKSFCNLCGLFHASSNLKHIVADSDGNVSTIGQISGENHSNGNHCDCSGASEKVTLITLEGSRVVEAFQCQELSYYNNLLEWISIP